jgi:hypothetical protein
MPTVFLYSAAPNLNFFSVSDSEQAKTFGFFRIWIHNTGIIRRFFVSFYPAFYFLYIFHTFENIFITLINAGNVMTKMYR